MNQSDFETNLKALEAINEQLASEQLSLEQALDLYEKGKSLAELCRAQLNDTARRLTVLQQDEHGERVEEPWQDDDTK